VDEEQVAQEAELTNGVITVVDGLLSFKPKDTHPHVGGLKHGHVVGAIAFVSGLREGGRKGGRKGGRMVRAC